MAYKKKDFSQYQERQRSRVEQAYDLFAEKLISKLETAQKTEWKKPWFTQELPLPRPLYGQRKPYHGMNRLVLLLLCEEKGYQVPYFATSDYFDKRFNYRYENGKRVPQFDKDGQKLPFVHINKGEHGFPVFYSSSVIRHKETNRKIEFRDYVLLSDEEKQNYNFKSYTIPHMVFSVDQTNLKEARPELYAQLLEDCHPKKSVQAGEDFVFEPLDEMLNRNEWICPVYSRFQNEAYYSPAKDEIVLPLKQQFIDMGHADAFYGTMLHEMIHSTGAEGRLNRLGGVYDEKAYAKEELVAEIGAAICCHFHGISNKYIKEDSIAYVQGWLDNLKENPSFIKGVLKDIKEATNIVDAKIDYVREMYLDEKVDKDDLREEEELAVMFDEDGDVQLTVQETLEPDKKQGEAEKPDTLQEEHRSGGIHR